MKKRKPRTYTYDTKMETLAPYSRHLAQCLELLRKANIVYQDQLANAVEISQQQLSNYESGWANPSLYYLVKIADFYKINVSDLINRKIDPHHLAIQSRINSRKIRH